MKNLIVVCILLLVCISCKYENEKIDGVIFGIEVDDSKLGCMSAHHRTYIKTDYGRFSKCGTWGEVGDTLDVWYGKRYLDDPHRFYLSKPQY